MPACIPLALNKSLIYRMILLCPTVPQNSAVLVLMEVVLNGKQTENSTSPPPEAPAGASALYQAGWI